MISLRKALFTLLAPLGAATIIGTGFATWVFGIQGVPVEGGPVNNNVAVTTELTNGSLKKISCPNVLVFSEGTQGKNDPFDGINFYTYKEIKRGQDFTISGLTNNHKLSFIYDDSIHPSKMYVSWADNSVNYRTIVVSGELKLTSNSSNGYFGTWTGESNDKKYSLKLTLKEDYSGIVDIASNEQPNINYQDNFSFVEYKDKENENPRIMVTDSTFAFQYYYDDPSFINEEDTGYKLNIELGIELNSKNSIKDQITFIQNGEALVADGDGKPYDSFTFKKNSNGNDYNLDVKISLGENFSTDRIVFQHINFEGENPSGENFPSGTYSGLSVSGIPCSLNLTNNNGTYTGKIEIASMNHYLSLTDEFTSHLHNGFFNITSDANRNYAETVLSIDIDEAHLTDDEPYLEFTCQLANYLRYSSAKVKPTEPDKYFGLRIASLLGGWEFKIIVNAYFTDI